MGSCEPPNKCLAAAVPALVRGPAGLQDGKNESWRYSGTVILIVITYSNEVTFNTNYVEYTVRVRQVSNTEFKTEQAIYLGGSSTKYDNWNRHGIRIIIAREGAAPLELRRLWTSRFDDDLI